MTFFNNSIQSRIHPLRSISSPACRVYIKREDELSSGVSGSKLRKYLSLIPFLINEKFDEVVIIGGNNSNNVIAAMQLFRENGIPFTLFLLESNSSKPLGNSIWLQMLHKGEPIQYISRLDWSKVNLIADNYAKESVQSGRKVFILREGAMVLEALPGAMSMADDILRNEMDSGIKFKHIFIDSGTGMSAIGLILGLEKLNILKKNIHITLIAGSEDEFRKNLLHFRTKTEENENVIFLQNLPLFFYKPIVAASFGSINKEVLNQCISIAKEEGILMEPVYSVKHFLTAKHIIASQNLEGDALIVYNGGSFGLAGFQESLAEILKA